MEIEIHQLREPLLEFGNGATGFEPKGSLASDGPFGSNCTGPPKEIICGVVGLTSEIMPIQKWIARMHTPLLSEEKNAYRYKPFPGLENAFRCHLIIKEQFIRIIDGDKYSRLAAEGGPAGFNGLLDLFGDSISSLFLDVRPDCILVAFPEFVAELRVTNSKLTFSERAVLERIEEEDEASQLMLFKPTDEEKRLAAELLPQADELLFRNFHRALKAKCMSLPNPVPLQVLTRHAYISNEAKQSDATRAWNLATAIYYKAGNIPWRPFGLAKSTCFIGLSFHHLKRRSGDLVYASVAQAFSSEVEPFTLKGASVAHDQVTIEKRPYLREDQAAELVDRVLDRFEKVTGAVPARLVIHKTSRYEPGEVAGFRDTTLTRVASCDLVWFAPTGFRLLRRGMQPPRRGTLCRVGKGRHFLFTTGYVDWWGEYPGPHIPAPLEIGAANDTDIIERSREILMLTKMNWNSAEALGRYPVTISFARKVGMVMTELEDDTPPNPLFRFYI
jgi:hypothetical protein